MLKSAPSQGLKTLLHEAKLLDYMEQRVVTIKNDIQKGRYICSKQCKLIINQIHRSDMFP